MSERLGKLHKKNLEVFENFMILNSMRGLCPPRRLSVRFESDQYIRKYSHYVVKIFTKNVSFNSTE